jgi:hypothetical protein
MASDVAAKQSSRAAVPIASGGSQVLAQPPPALGAAWSIDATKDKRAFVLTSFVLSESQQLSSLLRAAG